MQAKHTTAVATVPNPTPETEIGAEPLPAGFIALDEGIYQIGADGAATLTWLCASLVVKASFKDAMGAGRGRIAEFVDIDGRKQIVTILDRELETRFNKVRGDLADRGFRLEQGTKARSAFIQLLREWKPKEVLTSVHRLGWADQSCTGFVQSDGSVLGKGRFHFVAPSAADPRAKTDVSGTWQEWRDNVASLCRGNSLLVASVSLAFSAPLLELLGLTGGGLHLRGSTTSGKSTILAAAASISQAPQEMLSWSATEQGLAAAALRANSKLLCLDELGEIDGKVLDVAVYQLANGTGKLRSNSHGGTETPAQWHVAILSTGEITVAEKLAAARRRAMGGQEVRLIDVEADEKPYGAFSNLHGSKDRAEFGNRLNEASSRYYGAAGVEFVKKLAERPSGSEDSIRRVLKMFENQLKAKLKQGDHVSATRVLRRFALIATAGELATRMGLTGWPSKHSIAAVEELFEDWLERTRSVGVREGAEAVARTRSFLSANTARFNPLGAGKAEVAAGSCGWKDEWFYYFNHDTWHMIHGNGASAAAQALASAGLLELGDGAHLAKRMPGRCGARPRAYAVRVEVLSEPAPEHHSGAA